VQGVGGRDPAADFMKKIDVRLRAHASLVVSDSHRGDSTHVLPTIHRQWLRDKGVRGNVCVESSYRDDKIE
jgi:hypothetical protein